MSLFYKIGGLVIKTDDYFDDFARHHLSFYQADETASPNVCFTVHTDCENIQPPSGNLIAEVNGRQWYSMPDGGYAFVDYIKVLTDKVLNLVVANANFSKIEAWFCPSALLPIDVDRRPYFLIQEVLRYSLLFAGGTIIHASSLAYQGKGLLFSAPSGTGKSTHTNLWTKYAAGTEIVNDDMPIVRMIDNTPYLYGAPWSGKNSIHANITVPLSSVVFIRRGQTCELSPLDKTEAVWNLFQAVRKPVIPFLAERNLEIIGQIIENLPIYSLQCDISEVAVKTAMQAL